MSDTAHSEGLALLVSAFTGLKCDAPGCDWSDPSITRAQYPDYRNAPCPKCGANVLTDEDWNIVLNMERAAAWISQNGAALGLKPGDGQTVSIDFDDLKAALGAVAASEQVGTQSQRDGVNP